MGFVRTSRDVYKTEVPCAIDRAKMYDVVGLGLRGAGTGAHYVVLSQCGVERQAGGQNTIFEKEKN